MFVCQFTAFTFTFVSVVIADRGEIPSLSLDGLLESRLHNLHAVFFLPLIACLLLCKIVQKEDRQEGKLYYLLHFEKLLDIKGSIDTGCVFFFFYLSCCLF